MIRMAILSNMYLTPASNIWQNRHEHQNQHDGGTNGSNTGSVERYKKLVILGCR